jgi:formate hydrogenlyase subunit 6/NADH:ubiquinone oxidoreductase subunit I
MDNLWSWLIAAAVVGIFVVRYLITSRRKSAAARASAEKANLFSDGPRAQHPHIHVDSCIGCGSCVDACPEGNVLTVLNGKAAILNGYKCIGHGLCAEACPTMAIQMTPDYEICKRDIMDLVYEKEDLLIDGCGKDSSYNFYHHAGIDVTQPRGEGLEETPPVDVRSLMP